ncbi:MAG: glycerophosphoryl diester phosphodiesterase [Alphaproteobacteria bacterium]|nr:glycerophosphoryl diester phosphodiesterase [Alphaproteobacteria bacterium]
MTRASFRPLAAWPRVVGHRGAAALAPENTLAGMHMAARAGARAVELDLRLAADGAVVVLHDATLERTTDGCGLARRLNLAAIRAADAGAWFGPAFAGEPVPLLSEALALARDLGLAVNLELKADRGMAVATGRAVAAALKRSRSRPKLLLSSFSPRCLAAAGEFPRALIVGRGTARAWIKTARALDAQAVHVRYALLDRVSIAALHEAGLAVGAYTVNAKPRAKMLFGLGVDYVFTDDPRRIRA